MLRMLLIGVVLSFSIPATASTQLERRTWAVHNGQIRAQSPRARKRAEVRISKHYRNLVKMLRGRRRLRRTVARMLVKLVEQASTPGVSFDVKLYPRLNTRNHNRFNAVCERNLRRLLHIAAKLARGTWYQRSVAREMVKATRSTDFEVLVAMTRTSWRLGDRDNARWAAAQAILHFPPADRLVRTDTRPTRIGARDAATILKVLWVARVKRTPWHALIELRRQDTRYDGRSVVPRLQAIGFLASRTKTRLAARLRRELKRWEPVANFKLVAGPRDRWIPARKIARVSAMGLGHLQEAPVRLARRR